MCQLGSLKVVFSHFLHFIDQITNQLDRVRYQYLIPFDQSNRLPSSIETSFQGTVNSMSAQLARANAAANIRHQALKRSQQTHADTKMA